jgi:hypothetical protein
MFVQLPVITTTHICPQLIHNYPFVSIQFLRYFITISVTIILLYIIQHYVTSADTVKLE